MRGVALATALAVCSVGGCRSAPPPGPLELPAGLTLDTFHHAGSLLTGAVRLANPEALETDPTLALALVLEVVYVERLPDQELDPLTAHTRLLASLGGNQPILPVSETLRKARFGYGDEARRLRERLDQGEFGRIRPAPLLRGALPERATCLFSAQDMRPVIEATPDGGFVQRAGDRLSLEITRGEPGLGRNLSLAITAHQRDEQVAPVGPGDDADRKRALYFELEEQVAELVLLDPDLKVPGGPVVLVTADLRMAGEGAGFVTFLTIEAAPDPATDPVGAAAHREALERCIADCRLADELAEARSRWLSKGELRLVGFAAVLDTIQPGEVDRGFLVGLATAVRADLVGDVAMSADPERLDMYAKVLLQERQQLGVPETEDGIAWLLDRAAWRLLAEAALRTELPPEQQSIVLRHAGAVGRYPGTIIEALASCRGLDEFRQRIVEENWMLLRDTRPGVRVRAFDWLAAQENAPAGYDPMGPVAERREALEKFAEQLDARAAEAAALPPTPAGGGK